MEPSVAQRGVIFFKTCEQYEQNAFYEQKISNYHKFVTLLIAQ